MIYHPKDHPLPTVQQSAELTAAEAKYCLTAFDVDAAPLGSRDWTIYWRGWHDRSRVVPSEAQLPSLDAEKLLAQGLDALTSATSFLSKKARDQQPALTKAIRDYLSKSAAGSQPSQRGRSQHDADSRELLSLCQARDEARRERDLLQVDVIALEASVGNLSRLVDDLRPSHDRYQFLRDRPVNAIAIGKGGVFAGLVPDNFVLNGDELDAAIDQERATATKDVAHEHP